MAFRRVSLVEVGEKLNEKFGWQDEVVSDNNGQSCLTYYVGEFKGWRVMRLRDFQTAKRGINYRNVGEAYTKEEAWKKVWEEDVEQLYKLMKEEAMKYAKDNEIPFFDLTGREK